MTLARELVRALRASSKSLPEDVATAARLHFLDAIGVGLASAGSPIGAAYRTYAAEVAKASAERIAKEQKSRERLKNKELGVNMYGLKAKLLELGVRYVDDEQELSNG